VRARHLESLSEDTLHLKLHLLEYLPQSGIYVLLLEVYSVLVFELGLDQPLHGPVDALLPPVLQRLVVLLSHHLLRGYEIPVVGQWVGGELEKELVHCVLLEVVSTMSNEEGRVWLG
jgi:hypothetical protein